MYNDKAKYVFDVFENIATIYDEANDRISLKRHKAWKELLIKRLIDTMPLRGKLLDVACGTGDISIGMANRRKDLKIVGVDFSPSMLKEAKKKVGINNVTLKEADAGNLPFEDNYFNAACISFALRNMPDYKKVLLEMKRVVKKGGYIYCLDSFVPENRFIKPFYEIYFKYIMPHLGGGRNYQKEYMWLYKSTKEFLRKDELLKIFRDIGLKNVGYMSRMCGACILIKGKKANI